MTSLGEQIESCAADTNAFLAAHLGAGSPDMAGAPDRLGNAVRHGALAGGKRLRPFLVRAAAGLFGVTAKAAVRTGAAVECVHCYSLIHDDLPDMDNDRLRRGKPTVWAQFDPATAILAGDALLTQAFALLADPACHPDPETRNQLCRRLAEAAGVGGMAGGQMQDIEADAGMTAEAVLETHRMKTGALMAAAAAMGGMLGGAPPNARVALERYGGAAGLAFQLADDILDATQPSQALGKTAGKDAAQNKPTIVALEGLAGAGARLADAVRQAVAALDGFGPEADALRELARHFAARQA